MNYLLTASFLLVLIAPAYYLLLRYSERYGLNRWLFLLGMAVLCLLPTVNIPSPAPGTTASLQGSIEYLSTSVEVPLDAPVPEQSSGLVEGEVQYAGPTADRLSISPLTLIYLLGGGFFSLLFLGRMGFLLRTHLRSRSGPFPTDYRLLSSTAATGQAFTFLRNIYLSEDIANDSDLTLILAHERVHARQLHSLDILFSELFLCVFWFHPIAWWLRAKLRANLEYLVDAAIAKRMDKRAYQLALVRQGAAAQGLALALPFSEPSLKGRIQRLANLPRHWLVAAAASLALVLWLGTTTLIMSGTLPGSTETVEATVQQRPSVSTDLHEMLAPAKDGENVLKLYFKRLPYPDELRHLKEVFARLGHYDVFVYEPCNAPAGVYNLGFTGQTAGYEDKKMNESLRVGDNNYKYFEFQHNRTTGSHGTSVYSPVPWPEKAKTSEIAVQFNGEWVSFLSEPVDIYPAEDLARLPAKERLLCLLRQEMGTEKGYLWRTAQSRQLSLNRIHDDVIDQGYQSKNIRYFVEDKSVSGEELRAELLTGKYTLLQAGVLTNGTDQIDANKTVAVQLLR